MDKNNRTINVTRIVRDMRRLYSIKELNELIRMSANSSYKTEAAKLRYFFQMLCDFQLINVQNINPTLFTQGILDEWCFDDDLPYNHYNRENYEIFMEKFGDKLEEFN